LILSEYWSEIMRICTGVATIPLFWVDVPPSSESIGLSAEPAWPETKDKIESVKEFRPPGLPASQKFCRSKVFQVFVISNHINSGYRTLQITAPDAEGFKNRKELFIVHVIIELRRSERP
jgi:hypothetical protein